MADENLIEKQRTDTDDLTRGNSQLVEDNHVVVIPMEIKKSQVQAYE